MLPHFVNDLLDAWDVLAFPPKPTPEANPAPPVLGGKLARMECAIPRPGSNGGALLLSIVVAADGDGDGEDEEGVD